MNGSYQPLINYISEDSYRKINEYESKRQNELEFRVKNFFDKYADSVINYIINSIRDCDILSVYNTDTWNLSYGFLAADIKILDPNNPDGAMIVIKEFFKKCCNILSVEFEKLELAEQQGEKIIFVIYIKNPFIDKFKDKVRKIMEE